MHFPAFAQTAATAVAVAPPSLSTGEWVGVVGLGVMLIGAIYRLGVNSAETRHTKEMATSELKIVNEKLAEIAVFMRESQREELAWARWRGDIDTRVERLERADEDRRSGVPDRRHHD